MDPDGNVLTRKVGPLPVWAWAAIVFVGVYVYKKYTASQSANAAAATLTSSVGTETSGAAATPTTATGTGSGYASSADWQNAAASGAIQAGYNPSDVETALANYQNGNPLSSAQEAILNYILQTFGPSPGGAVPVIAGTIPPPQASGQSTGSSSETAANSFKNPYPVGTIVSKTGEKIAHAVGAGQFGYVDVTSEGGLYTLPGVRVSGSEYSGKTGNYSAQVIGNQVWEYGPDGVKVFSLSGKPSASYG